MSWRLALLAAVLRAPPPSFGSMGDGSMLLFSVVSSRSVAYSHARVDDAGRALGTLQLGHSAAVAERLGLPVICDLRSRDVAAGGQGAPLVSTFDQLLLAGHPGVCGSAAAVNLGGIANLTVVDGGQVLTAYDIGPAGALMDPATSWASVGTSCCPAAAARPFRGPDPGVRHLPPRPDPGGPNRPDAVRVVGHQQRHRRGADRRVGPAGQPHQPPRRARDRRPSPPVYPAPAAKTVT
jgi:Anhydro-N-acetylmuramic acid kinase